MTNHALMVISRDERELRWSQSNGHRRILADRHSQKIVPIPRVLQTSHTEKGVRLRTAVAVSVSTVTMIPSAKGTSKHSSRIGLSPESVAA